MNPLTLVKRIQKINSQEAALGISEDASWHAKYKESAYVFIGGIPYDLTEGDLLAVFAQYGEIVDVNLVRDKGTGKSKGFAFLAFEDQRSTNLAVDNLNGAQVLGRIIRVDHVANYKKKEEEDEQEQQRKREERGVCRAFQRGECTRGSSCKFSHDEQRAANTGWGEDNKSRWGHDKFEVLRDKFGSSQSNRVQKYLDKDLPSRSRDLEISLECHIRQSNRRNEKTYRRYNDEELRYRDNQNGRENERGKKYGTDELDHCPEIGSKREVVTSRRQEGDSYKSREDTISRREDKRLQRLENMEKDFYRREQKKKLNRLDSSEVGSMHMQDHDWRESNGDQNKKQEKRKRYDDHDGVPRLREDHDRRQERRLARKDNDKSKSKSRENSDRIPENRSTRYESEYHAKDDLDEKFDRRGSLYSRQGK